MRQVHWLGCPFVFKGRDADVLSLIMMLVEVPALRDQVS